ncbi:hypothetical protein Tco_0424457 [Tanacetum coccineum]
MNRKVVQLEAAQFLRAKIGVLKKKSTMASSTYPATPRTEHYQEGTSADLDSNKGATAIVLYTLNLESERRIAVQVMRCCAVLKPSIH